MLDRFGKPPSQAVAGTACKPLALLLFGPIGCSGSTCSRVVDGRRRAELAAGLPRTAFAVIAAALLNSTKSLVLASIAFVYVWRTRGRREALVGLIWLCAIGLAVLLPFVIADHVGVYLSFAQQANRHLQLETLGSSALLVAHLAGVYAPHVTFDAGADTLAGALPNAACQRRTASSRSAFSRRSGWRNCRWLAEMVDALVESSIAAVAAFVILGKVLSPQFLLWLVPLAVLLRYGRTVVAVALLAPAVSPARHLPAALRRSGCLDTGPILCCSRRGT